ncbi:hypothetical protein ASG52_08405 [Methylobacterium sp. Leaf456]|uniref:tyrosine-type recombinase/integrase n=1 Tax=Methylobacterium sp. Leaf456 TaxID=1736382 RepID=UPI0006F62105|nr:site-specific integrase [Methylobacterium sp. Leaf456]KQT50078.1 hypothetical protein ASG52_08405 [Methylobacterium sp. Leaf456]
MASVAKRKWTNAKGEQKENWEVLYKEGGKHRSQTFKLKRHADAFKRKVENELHEGTHVASADGVTLDAAAADFERHLEDRMISGALGKQTARNYRGHLRNHVLPTFGRHKFHEIRPVEVHDWFRGLMKNGMKKRGLGLGAAGGGLSGQFARRSLNVLSIFFRWGIPRSYAKTNPCIAGLAMLGGVRKSKIETFTREDVVAILRAVETRAWKHHDSTHAILKCSVHLAVFCGLRIGEIMGLTRPNVMLDAGIIQARHSLTCDDELKGPKSKSGIRDVPMPPHLVLLLREYLAKHHIPNRPDLVFRTRSAKDGGEPAQIVFGVFRANSWHPLLARSGVTSGAPHFHALRHFAASLMIDEGLPLTEVASLMGHSTFDMTLQVYAHPLVNGHRRRAACDAIANSMLGAPIEANSENGRAPLRIGCA